MKSWYASFVSYTFSSHFCLLSSIVVTLIHHTKAAMRMRHLYRYSTERIYRVYMLGMVHIMSEITDVRDRLGRI